MTPSTEREVDEIVAGDAGRAGLGERARGKIEQEAIGPGLGRGHHEFFGKESGDFGPDFVRGAADRRPCPYEEVGRAHVEGAFHRRDRVRDEAADEAAPSRVSDAERSGHRVQEEQGHAIRDRDREHDSRFAGDDAVKDSFGGGAALHDADVRRVMKLRRDDDRLAQPHILEKETAPFAHGVGIFAAREREVAVTRVRHAELDAVVRDGQGRRAKPRRRPASDEPRGSPQLGGRRRSNLR